MKNSRCNAALAIAFLAASAGANVAQAAFVNSPVPLDAYITFGGLDWAWASPVAGDGSYVPAPGEPVGTFTGLDLSYQSQFGWRLATSSELVFAPSAFDFIFAGANVPLGASDAVSGAFNYPSTNPNVIRPGALACATPYFSMWSRACNWQNGPGSGDRTSGPWWQPGEVSYRDTLVVRNVLAVPEPSSYLLMLGGLIALVGCSKTRARISPA